MSAATKGRNRIRSFAHVASRTALAVSAATLLTFAFATSQATAQATSVDQRSRAQGMHVRSGWILIGFVKDELGNPIEGAEIIIGSDATRATTDTEGRFRIAGIPAGLNYVGARRIGYLPAVDLVRLSPADTLQFTLDHIGQKMDTVKVKARAEAAWARDVRRYAFATESARYGAILTDRDIAERAPIVTSDLLRSRNGFNVIGSGPLARVVGSRSRCSPTIFLDGQPLVGFNINDIAPSTIKLLVTYPSFSSLPVALQTTRGDPSCGVIVILSL